LSNAVLPPFREDLDDDTVRDFAPVALASFTWMVTTVAILIVGLRRYLRQN